MYINIGTVLLKNNIIVNVEYEDKIWTINIFDQYEKLIRAHAYNTANEICDALIYIDSLSDISSFVYVPSFEY